MEKTTCYKPLINQADQPQVDESEQLSKLDKKISSCASRFFDHIRGNDTDYDKAHRTFKELKIFDNMPETKKRLYNKLPNNQGNNANNYTQLLSEILADYKKNKREFMETIVTNLDTNGNDEFNTDCKNKLQQYFEEKKNGTSTRNKPEGKEKNIFTNITIKDFPGPTLFNVYVNEFLQNDFIKNDNTLSSLCKIMCYASNNKFYHRWELSAMFRFFMQRLKILVEGQLRTNQVSGWETAFDNFTCSKQTVESWLNQIKNSIKTEEQTKGSSEVLGQRFVDTSKQYFQKAKNIAQTCVTNIAQFFKGAESRINKNGNAGLSVPGENFEEVSFKNYITYIQSSEKSKNISTTTGQFLNKIKHFTNAGAALTGFVAARITPKFSDNAIVNAIGKIALGTTTFFASKPIIKKIAWGALKGYGHITNLWEKNRK